MSLHTNGRTLVWLIELCLYSKSNGLFSMWKKVPTNVKARLRKKNLTEHQRKEQWRTLRLKETV